MKKPMLLECTLQYMFDTLINSIVEGFESPKFYWKDGEDKMKIYTVSEIAEKLKCNKVMIMSRLQKGIIKGKKQKGEWLITEENLLEYTKGIEEPMLVKEFAEIVRKNVKTIRDKVISGELRGVKCGNWYVDKNELNKFI